MQWGGDAYKHCKLLVVNSVASLVLTRPQEPRRNPPVTLAIASYVDQHFLPASVPSLDMVPLARIKGVFARTLPVCWTERASIRAN